MLDVNALQRTGRTSDYTVLSKKRLACMLDVNALQRTGRTSDYTVLSKKRSSIPCEISVSNIAKLRSKVIRFKRDEKSFNYWVFRKRIGPIFLDPGTGPQALPTLLFCFFLGMFYQIFRVLRLCRF